MEHLTKRTFSWATVLLMTLLSAFAMGVLPGLAHADDAVEQAAGQLTVQSSTRPTVFSGDRTYTYDGSPHAPDVQSTSGHVYYFDGDPLTYDGTLTVILNRMRVASPDNYPQWMLPTEAPTITDVGTLSTSYIVLAQDLPTDEDMTSLYQVIAYNNNPETAKEHPDWSGSNCSVVIGTVNVTVEPADLSSSSVHLSSPIQKYTGSRIVPEVTVEVRGRTLTKGTDYTVSCSNNVNIGTATMTITGKGNYTGTTTAQFEIRSTTRPTVYSGDRTYTYDGSPHAPYVQSTPGSVYYYNGDPLTYNSSLVLILSRMRLASPDNYPEWMLPTEAPTITDVGTLSTSYIALTQDLPTDFDMTSLYQVIAYNNNPETAREHPEWAESNCSVVIGTVSVTVEPANLSSSTVTLSSSAQKYTGSPIVPEATVEVRGRTLAKGTDYTVSCSNNVNVGTATMTITGKGNYTGTKTAQFTITPSATKDLSSCTMTLSPSSFTYDGAQKAPTVTIRDGSTTLTAGADYDVSLPSGRTNPGTYTVTATGKGNYTGTKSATFTIAPAPSSSIGLDELTYSFGNSYEDFGYPDPYYIPEESYKLVFNDVMAKWYHAIDDEWGGNCFGMASSATMFNIASSDMKLRDFNASATHVSDLAVEDKKKSNSIPLKRYIEALQVSQYDSGMQDAEEATWNKLSDLCAEVEKAQNGGIPVSIGVYGPEGGHALVGYRIEKVSSSLKRLYVYDCNFPGEIRYITVSTNSSGTPTGWYYHLNDEYDWGSSYWGCGITYTPYSAIESVWRSGGGKHVLNSLSSNAKNYTVANSNGAVVAKVEDGVLTKAADGVFQYRSKSLNGKNAAGKPSILYLPSDEVYRVVNGDEKLDQFEVGMVNVEQSAVVETEADSVTFAVSDSDEVNLVDVDAGRGDAYSVQLNSSLRSAAGQELVELSGIGNGTALSMGMASGNCVIVNGSSAALYVNGGQVDIGSRADVSGFDVALEYSECYYDGKAHEPAVTVKNGAKTLTLGADYVVVYSDNVEPGTARAAVYGINDYSGKAEKTFQIKQRADVSSCSVTVSGATYTGKALKPAVKVRYGSAVLKEGTDYTLAYSNNVNAGAGSVTITGKGNYAGAKTARFAIAKAANRATAAKLSVSKTVKAKALKKKAKTVALPTVTTGFGKASWTVATKDKKKVLSLSGGKVKVKKGAKKGSYTIKLRARVAGTANYLASSSKVVTVKVRVK